MILHPSWGGGVRGRVWMYLSFITGRRECYVVWKALLPHVILHERKRKYIFFANAQKFWKNSSADSLGYKKREAFYMGVRTVRYTKRLGQDENSFGGSLTKLWHSVSISGEHCKRPQCLDYSVNLQSSKVPTWWTRARASLSNSTHVKTHTTVDKHKDPRGHFQTKGCKLVSIFNKLIILK